MQGAIILKSKYGEILRNKFPCKLQEKESYLIAKGVFISYLVQCPITSYKENKHLERAIHPVLRIVGKTTGLGELALSSEAFVLLVQSSKT